MTSRPEDDPILTVRRAPDTLPGDLTALRIVRVDVTHSGEWPWRRLSGTGTAPPQHSDVSDWPVDPVGDLAADLGHTVVLAGREVGRR